MRGSCNENKFYNPLSYRNTDTFLEVNCSIIIIILYSFQTCSLVVKHTKIRSILNYRSAHWFVGKKNSVLLRSTTIQIRSKHRETKQASINATFIKFPLTEAGNPVLNTAFRMKHLNSISLHQVSQINDVHLKEFTTENLLKFKRVIFTSLHWPDPCHKFLIHIQSWTK